MSLRLDKLADVWDPVLQKAFLDSVYNLRDAAQLDQIIKALLANDVESAIKMVGLNPVSLRPFDKALSSAFEHAGTLVSDGLPDVKLNDGFRVQFQFDVRNPSAEKFLAEKSSELVTAILDDQRDMIRQYLSDGLARGDNPRTTALDLVGRIGASGKREGGVIGLTATQAEWVRNYEAELRSDNPADALQRDLRDARFDAAVQRAIDSGEPIPDSLISKMVDSYENRALRYRAEAIARKETITALHSAQEEAMDQAIATGAIDPKNVTQTWHITRDKRTRESHIPMDGQTVGYGEMFVTGAGNYLAYPGDPDGLIEETAHCRCHRSFNVDFLAGIE